MSQKPNPFRRGLPVHVGDAYSPEYVREVRWLSIENAFGDYCWRISVAHLGVQAERYLADLVDDAMKGFLFVPFRISHRRILGVYLIATPWTEAHLQSTQGMSAEALRQSHRDAGVPEALADVLHLAAQAGARAHVRRGCARVGRIADMQRLMTEILCEPLAATHRRPSRANPARRDGIPVT